jgi:hypothetical protein
MDVLLKRILYGGIGIAVVWLIFISLPVMWLRNVNHPLLAVDPVDVCAYFNEAVLATLPRAPEKIAPQIPDEPTNPMKSMCGAVLPPESRTDPRNPFIWASVSSERSLRRMRTDAFVDTWLKESAASGNDVTPLKGPWRRGALIKERGRPGRITLLADDAGVVLWINARDIDEPAFVAFAEAMALNLRGKLKPKPKQ